MRWVKVVSFVLIVASGFVVVRALPVARVFDAMETVLAGLGVWAPVAFILIYVIATVLVLPGSVLTLAAGAMFGFGIGVICVSIGATAGAACAFLIARFVARRRVARVIRRSPRLNAVDRAIGERGWRVVALLRLAPIIPFNLQNYLYGLTSIRFWPCVLTSAIAMVPGIAMYTYVGHLARQGAAAAAGVEEATVGVSIWVLRLVGLFAAVAATVYLARIATRAMARQTALVTPETTDDAPVSGPETPPRRSFLPALAAVAAVGVAVVVHLNRDSLSRAIGRYLPPPRVMMVEAYVSRTGGPVFDHAVLDRLLKAHVDEDGLVDYAGLRTESSSLDAYFDSVAAASFDDLGRDEKLALLLNAYNAFTLRLVLDHDGIESVREIAAAERWEAARWSIGGTTVSLSQIEHEWIRPNFREPRVHFALVCAAIGCPPLRSEAYVGARLESQLSDQAARVHADARWFTFDGMEVHLTPLYGWYRGDFEQVSGTVLEYVAGYDAGLRTALDEGDEPPIEWLQYDWALNNQR